MSGQISEQIDRYAKGNLRKLKQEEAKAGRKFTKYDIAQKMLSEGKLSESDFASWMNTTEGYESSVLTSRQKQALMQGSVWSFNQNNESYLDEFDTYIKDPLTGVKINQQSQSRTQVSSELKKDSEIRDGIIDMMLNNARSALAMIESYHNNIGYISADAFVQGMNVLGDVSWDLLTGRQDFVTVFEQEEGLKQEIEALKNLKTKTKAPMEFAREFKKLYGVDFDPAKFQRLSDISKQLNELNVYTGLNKYFEFGIEKLKDTDMNTLDAAAYLAPVFGNSPIKAQEYINKLKSECKNDEELKAKLTSILVESKKETEAKLSLLEINRERLEKDFKEEYKSAFGNYKSDEIIAEYINIQRMNAMGTEVAGTIVLSMFTMGSSAVMNISSKVISKMGVKVGSQVVKAGMTGTMAAVPAAETVVGGLTSREGMTLERGKQAWEELKNGLMYGAFGAYVSGPLGNVVSKVLSKNPQIFKSILSSHKFSIGAGATVETTADVLFDRITSDLSFKESLAQNGIMNFGMMFVGSKINKGTQLPDVDLSQVKIEKMRDGSYNLKANGKVFYKAKNDDELAVVTLALGAKSAAGSKETDKNALQLQKQQDDSVGFEVNAEDFTGFTANLNANKISYETYTDNDGNKVVKIVSSAERKSPASGVNFKYIVLKYGHDGKFLDAAENVTDKDISEKFGKLKDRQIVDNSDGSNAGNLYAGISVPMLKKISNVIGFGKLKNSLKIEIYMKKQLSFPLEKATPEAKQEVKYFLNQVLEKNPDINFKNNYDLYEFSNIIFDIKKRDPNFNTNELSNAIAKLFNSCSDGEYTLKNLANILSDFVFNRNNNIETGAKLFKSLSDNGLNKAQIESLFGISRFNGGIGLLDRFQDWDSLINIIPYLKDTKEIDLFYILDIIACAKNEEIIKSNTASYNKSILNSLENLSNDLKKHFIEKGIYVDKLEEKLSSITTMKGYEIPVDKELQNRFLKSIITNNNFNAENIIKSDDFYNYLQEHSASGLHLKYSRSTFIKDINSLLSKLPEADRNKVLKDLGITLGDNDFNGLVRYNKLNTENYDTNLKDIISRIKDCAGRFALKNELECSNPEIKSILDDLIQGFPEFTSIIGKQNGSSSNTLDIHILEVLHNAEKNPDYSNLSDSQKTILKFSILMHDLAKQVDESNMEDIATKSSILSSSILDKFDLSQDTKERIVNMVAHHYIYQTEPSKHNKYIQLIEDLYIAKIITQADIKSESGQKISTKGFTLGKGGANYLPITRCHVKYENYQKHQRNINGKIYEYRLESLDEIPAESDMSKYGFIGMKKEDIVIQTHSVEKIAFLRKVITNYDDPTYYMAISTSVRKLTNSDNGYGKYTLVLSTSKMNRGGGNLYWKMNGYGKNINDFNSYNWSRLGIRSITGIPQEVADYVASLEYPTLIKDTEINGTLYTKEELTDIWKKITNDITSTGINEVLAANPKPQLIIVHDCKSKDELPDELIMIASKYKIPIFIEEKK